MVLWFEMNTTRTDIGKARKKIFAKNELLSPPTKAALEEHVKRAA